MSRLRQKYKKLKEKYELLGNLPVEPKYIFCWFGYEREKIGYGCTM